MLNALRQRSALKRRAAALLAGLSAQARLPVFYETYSVPDTIDGRFDLLVLHAWLVLDRLSEQKLKDLAQGVIDDLFMQFDEALRQQGAGDMAMGRRMTKMADAFYGRVKAYGDAGDADTFAAAIVRNVFRGNDAMLEPAKRLAIYIRSAREELRSQDLSAGDIIFGPIP